MAHGVWSWPHQFVQTEQKLSEQKQQAKLIFRRITPQSESMLSIEGGAYTLQYAVIGLGALAIYSLRIAIS